MAHSGNVFPGQLLQRNFRHLNWDVFWFGVLVGSTLSFQAVYAARLGANSFQIGLLTAGPALVNLFFTLPAGRWLHGRSLFRVSFISSVLQRSGYLVLVGLPWLVSPTAQVWGIAWTVLIISIPGTLLAISFNSLFADIVPAGTRSDVVGRRNALVAVSVTLSALLSGQILDRLVFPLNYQVVFFIGAVGALLSSFHLGRLRPLQAVASDPIRAVAAASNRSPHFWSWLNGEARSLLRLDLIMGPFGLFMLAYLTFYVFQYAPLPLFPLFFVNELHLTDSEISLGTAVFHAMMMLGSLRLGWVSTRLGHHRVLMFSALLFAHYPLMLALADNAVLYWVSSVTGGLLFAMLNGGLINRLMERVPDHDRPAHMALHNLALNMGILIGSFLGPLLGDVLGLRDALFLAAGLRFLAGLFIWRWG